MSHKEFPKMKFHAENEPLIVNSAAEERELGSEWHDEPQKGQARFQVVGDDAFNDWLAENDLLGETVSVREKLLRAYLHQPAQATAPTPTPLPDMTKEEQEAKRKALLSEAESMGITIHHASGIEKIQAAIDAKKAETKE